MGNASNLRKNPTWSTILDEMEKEGQIGFGFPIVCPRHPDKGEVVSEPGRLPKIAPLGMGINSVLDASLTPPRWLLDSMRVQAPLWTYLPIVGKEWCFYRSAQALTFLATT